MDTSILFALSASTQLVIFKLIALIFPTSDFKHPVVTPTLLFMGQLLLKVSHTRVLQDSTAQHQCSACCSVESPAWRRWRLDWL